MCAERVEADDARLVAHYEHPGQVAALILARTMTEPVIEIGLAAGEMRAVVLRPERLDRSRHANQSMR